jgi:ATP-dependent Lon protease
MKERYLLEDVSDNGFSLITDYDGNDEQAFDVNIKSGEILPVLPLRNMILFPGVFLPITAGRKSSLKLIRDAEKKHKDIAVVCQRAAHTEDPKLEDLHNIGTVGRIVRVLEMPDQTTTVILQGMKRLSLKSITDTHPYLKGEVEILEEEIPGKDDKEFQALVETCKDLTMRYIKSSDAMHQDSAFAIKNINSPMFLINFICSNLPFKKDEKIDLLSIKSLRERTYHLLELLNREVQLAEIKASIQMRAREDIDQQQREYFLRCPRISASSCTPPKDIRTYFRLRADAMDFPSDVLPTPGGPYKQIIGDFMSSFSFSTARCSKIRSFTFSNP